MKELKEAVLKWSMSIRTDWKWIQAISLPKKNGAIDHSNAMTFEMILKGFL